MTTFLLKRTSEFIMCSAKAPKRRKAVFMIEPIPKRIQKTGANEKSGFFNGKLIIDGHNFYSDDANILASIAYICNVSSVSVSTLSTPQSITIKARATCNSELELLDNFSERIFLKQFHEVLYLCKHSRKQSVAFVEQWEMKLFPLAFVQVPLSLCVHTKLERGVYDEAGMPMSLKAIARQALDQDISRYLENAIQGKLPQLPDVLNIDLTRITRHKCDAVNGNNTDHIIYSDQVKLAMHRLINHFGFDRLPSTWGELNGMLDYCKYLWMASGDKFVPFELMKAWQKTSRNIDQKLAPWRIPAFDAYVVNDIKKLRNIHQADKTMERLGIEWKDFDSGRIPTNRPLVKNKFLRKRENSAIAVF
jgi:hypothetical protein